MHEYLVIDKIHINCHHRIIVEMVTQHWVCMWWEQSKALFEHILFDYSNTNKQICQTLGGRKMYNI